MIHFSSGHRSRSDDRQSRSSFTGSPASARHGFVIIVVLLALGVVGILAMALATSAWRDDVASTQSLRAQQLSMRAEESLALAGEKWFTDSLWRLEPGAARSYSNMHSPDERVDVTIERDHPLAIRIRSEASSRDARRLRSANRTAVRALWLQPPALAVDAALTVNGAVEAADPTLITGLDVADAGSPCGSSRDTLSTRSIIAESVQPETAAVWNMLPFDAQVGAVDSVAGVSELNRELLMRVTPSLRSSTPAPLTGNETSPSWHLALLRGPGIVLSGSSHFRGLLYIDGSLEVNGNLVLEGVLVVREVIDSRSGSLSVKGALLVLNQTETLSHGAAAQFGSRTSIAYDRCRILMALATVAKPVSQPFGIWSSGPP